jgi:glucosamine--fructose-6-phosphate aminotransferase (isomerizing)
VCFDLDEGEIAVDLAVKWRDCSYLHDLIEQPDALGRSIRGLSGEHGLDPLAGALRSGRWRRVVLTGMGSSFWACRPLYLRLLQEGVTPVMVETGELIHYEQDWLTPDTLVIAVSQSGRSVEILRLLECASKRSGIIGVTNTPGSPLATGSIATLLMHAGAEHTVSCKTYLATLLALDWLGDLLSGESREALLDQARAAVEPMREYLRQWPAHVEQLMPVLEGVADIFVVGRGASISAAETGGLILKESTHYHAEGLSAASFRHGPFEMLSDSVFVLVLEGDARSAPFSRKLVADIREAGGRSALVSTTAGGVFRIPESAERLRPVMEFLPVEMLTLALAATKGREPGRFERATKVTEVE